MINDFKRITVFAGHYGSGKTNIAVNYATLIREKTGKDVSLADLDIVNPYYRAKDSEERLEKLGIRMISSPYANSNVDLPALPSEAYAIIDDKESFAVCDVGGDDRGAYALGRYSDKLKEEDNYEMYFVFNAFRPLTPDATSAYEVMQEIEEACRMKFTAVINNSNIGELTDEKAVLTSAAECDKLSEMAGIPVAFTCVSKDIYDKMKERGENIFPLELQKKII